MVKKQTKNVEPVETEFYSHAEAIEALREEVWTAEAEQWLKANPEAVVEFSSQEAVDAFDRGTGIDIRSLTQYEQDDLLDAMVGVEQFGSFDDDGRFTPHRVEEHPFEQQVRTLMLARSLTYTAALRKVREAVCAFATKKGYRIASVLSYLDGDWDWTTPSFVFIDIPTSSPTFVAGEREAMCVWYQPSEPWSVRTKVRDRSTGEIVTAIDERRSDRCADGYSHIVRYYASSDAAAMAADDIRSAQRTVRQISRDAARRAFRDDPVRSVGIEDAAFEALVATPPRQDF